jgi:hypothetical protein
LVVSQRQANLGQQLLGWRIQRRVQIDLEHRAVGRGFARSRQPVEVELFIGGGQAGIEAFKAQHGMASGGQVHLFQWWINRARANLKPGMAAQIGCGHRRGGVTIDPDHAATSTHQLARGAQRTALLKGATNLGIGALVRHRSQPAGGILSDFDGLHQRFSRSEQGGQGGQLTLGAEGGRRHTVQLDKF